MVKVSVLYPNSAGGTFDMMYYLNTHVQWSDRSLAAR
jgi:hypothetical protein